MSAHRMSSLSIRRLALPLLLAAMTLASTLIPLPVAAHGERATEPYIRTRTVHWYDVTWSSQQIGVNDTVTVEGKFHLFTDWPDAASKPELAFLSNATPGAVMTRVESYINGMPAQQSVRQLEIGGDYSFKLVMAGRIPGRWHLHPVLNVHGAGPIVGPGHWVEVTGNAADYKLPVTTMTGEVIDDLQHYGVARVQWWQAGYALLALGWIIWWIRRPLIVPRWNVIRKGREDLLITRLDDRVAAAMLVLVLVLVIGGYRYTTQKYEYVVPLQAGSFKTKPLPQAPSLVAVEMTDATYDVPGRSLRLDVEITNQSDTPMRLGEFSTANLRFLNQSLEVAVAGVDPSFPKDLIAGSGLKLSDDSPIAPGQKRTLRIEATDAAWEIERLVSFLTNVDSRVGGMLFFYDAQGQRHMAEVFGPIIPVFTQLQLSQRP